MKAWQHKGMAGFFNRIASALRPSADNPTDRGSHSERARPTARPTATSGAPSAEPLRVGGVGRDTVYEAAERAQAPLSAFMTRLMAQELPMLDSTSRRRVNEIMREYTGPTITSTDELPAEVREIMDL